MAIDYALERRNADQALREAGAAAYVLTQFQAGEYQASTSEVDRQSSQFTGIALRTNYEARDVDGVYITENDVKFIVSGLLANGQVMPKANQGSEILFAGEKYFVQGCKAIDFTGVPVLFQIQGRSAIRG